MLSWRFVWLLAALPAEAKTDGGCANLKAAQERFQTAPFTCNAQVARIMSEPWNAGIGTAQAARIREECLNSEQLELAKAQEAFFFANKRRILKVDPSFDVLRSIQAKWTQVLNRSSVCRPAH